MNSNRLKSYVKINNQGIKYPFHHKLACKEGLAIAENDFFTC